MAGDWIKIEHVTPDKPEVVRMAQQLDIDQDAVVGKLIRLWIWADQQTTDGNALSVTDSFIDRCTFATGFAQALRDVGWLGGDGSELSLPNFGRHNGKTAKTRALTNKRVSEKRKRNAASVTEGDQKALPEKRREEKRRSNKTQGTSSRFVPPTIEEVADYCRQRGNSVNPQAFLDHYSANGWMRGKNKIKDWKACVRTWEQNQNERQTPTRHLPGNSAAAREERNADAFAIVLGEDEGEEDRGGAQKALQYEEDG